MWQDSKIQIVTPQKFQLGQNSKTEDVTIKIKIWLNPNCERNQKLKLWQNSKTEIVTKLKNLNCDKTLELKYRQNSTTQIVTKLKTQSLTKVK